MIAYPNGKVPAFARRKIDTAGRTLRTPAATSWAWVVSEVKRRYGWTPEPSAGLSAYRTVPEQERLFYDYFTTSWEASEKRDRRYYKGKTYWRRKGKPSAATPGTSNHGKALALDIAGLGDFGSTKHRQLADVATEAGWRNEGVAFDEPWHWLHDGKTAPPKPKPAPKPEPAPTPTTNEEIDMIIIRRGLSIPKGKVLPYAVIAGDRAVVIPQPAAARFKKAGVKVVPQTEADYDKLVKALVSEK